MWGFVMGREEVDWGDTFVSYWLVVVVCCGFLGYRSMVRLTIIVTYITG
jgi:hypothetical protein